MKLLSVMMNIKKTLDKNIVMSYNTHRKEMRTPL